MPLWILLNIFVRFFSSYEIAFSLVLQAHDRYVLGQRSFKKAYCPKAIEAVIFQASQIQWLHLPKNFGRSTHSSWSLWSTKGNLLYIHYLHVIFCPNVSMSYLMLGQGRGIACTKENAWWAEGRTISGLFWNPCPSLKCLRHALFQGCRSC